MKRTKSSHHGFPNTWFLNGGDLPEELVARIATSLCPPLLVSGFDRHRFARLLYPSISLDLLSTNRVVEALPTLSAFQVDELEAVFVEEANEFALLDDESRQVALLSAGAIVKALSLAAFHGCGYPDVAEEAKAIRGMARRKVKDNPTVRHVIPHGCWGLELVEFVYGEIHRTTPRQADGDI